MSLTCTQLKQYCERIGYAGPLDTTFETLQALQLHHVLNVSFENLDSWQGQPPAIDPATLFDKLVLRRRGGYCFEQNGLFMLVLQTLGFSVQGLSARVLWNQPADARPPRTHQALMVELKGQEWLVDVGFGGLTPLAPLRLETELQQATPLETLRLRQSGNGLLLEVFLNDSVRPVYWFQPEASMPADFVQSNWFVATHPESRFVKHLVASCVRREVDGSLSRHALLDRDYSVYRVDQAPRKRTLESAAELELLLKDTFTLPIASLPALQAKLAGLF